MGDLGSIPGSGRFPEEGNGSPFLYSCLRFSMDRGAYLEHIPIYIQKHIGITLKIFDRSESKKRKIYTATVDQSTTPEPTCCVCVWEFFFVVSC